MKRVVQEQDRDPKDENRAFGFKIRDALGQELPSRAQSHVSLNQWTKYKSTRKDVPHQREKILLDWQTCGLGMMAHDLDHGINQSFISLLRAQDNRCCAERTFGTSNRDFHQTRTDHATAHGGE